MSVVQKLDEAKQALLPVLRKHMDAGPPIGVVLGSGLGAFGDVLDDLTQVPYATIPHMPQSKVIGHAGNLCAGTAEGANVLCLQGRVHLYEGHEPERVVFGVRLLAHLGCRAVLLTNAAGGIDPSFAPGDLMLVTDHLNLMGKNPLIGPNEGALGTRFPDMTEAYDRRLSSLVRESAAALGLPLREGVYAGLLGPTYETPAEIRMLRGFGAHAVGMSTVPEVIALRHMGARAAAISCITNMAAGMSGQKLDHSEVEETAKRTRDRFIGLLRGFLARAEKEIAA